MLHISPYNNAFYICHFIQLTFAESVMDTCLIYAEILPLILKRYSVAICMTQY